MFTTLPPHGTSRAEIENVVYENFSDPVPVGVAELDVIEAFLGDVLSDVLTAASAAKVRLNGLSNGRYHHCALALAKVASTIRRYNRNQDRNTAT